MRGWSSWAARAEDTLSLREDMVESGTGHVPTEFWSSLESRVGFQESVSCARSLRVKVTYRKGGLFADVG